MFVGWSKAFLITGCADGSVSIRATQYPSVFIRCVGHNSVCGGVSVAALSFDDNYALSVGMDGVLVVHRIR